MWEIGEGGGGGAMGKVAECKWTTRSKRTTTIGATLQNVWGREHYI